MWDKSKTTWAVGIAQLTHHSVRSGGKIPRPRVLGFLPLSRTSWRVNCAIPTAHVVSLYDPVTSSAGIAPVDHEQPYNQDVRTSEPSVTCDPHQRAVQEPPEIPVSGLCALDKVNYDTWYQKRSGVFQCFVTDDVMPGALPGSTVKSLI